MFFYGKKLFGVLNYLIGIASIFWLVLCIHDYYMDLTELSVLLLSVCLTIFWLVVTVSDLLADLYAKFYSDSLSSRALASDAILNELTAILESNSEDLGNYLEIVRDKKLELDEVNIKYSTSFSSFVVHLYKSLRGRFSK